jgi:hypothetical protein
MHSILFHDAKSDVDGGDEQAKDSEEKCKVCTFFPKPPGAPDMKKRKKNREHEQKHGGSREFINKRIGVEMKHL